MNWKLLISFLLAIQLNWTHVYCDIEYNTINADGSYQFRHSNDDIGGYYHSASGSSDNIVRGRYGSRNPTSGKIEETVYTAGPRGFRVTGTNVHRKMDLQQFPPRLIGSPDDPLADPFDDPSYTFTYRTEDQSRTEDNDKNGYLQGLYSFIDDAGERHNVRYAAGAETGFEISNAVPDNPTNVAYAAPLFKSHPRTRGKMAVQRGPLGSYKLIAAGPDHRRAESRNTDGLVRGTYSFLDDKGIQHTVEYIAGAGIGYRVVQNRIGPGTHINPSISDFRLNDKDFRLASDFGKGAVVNDIIGDVSARSGSSLNDRRSSAIGLSSGTSTSDSSIDGVINRSGSDFLKTTNSVHPKGDERLPINGADDNDDAANTNKNSQRKTNYNVETASVNRENVQTYSNSGGKLSNNGRSPSKVGERSDSDGNSLSSAINTRMGLRSQISGPNTNRRGSSFGTSRSDSIGNTNKPPSTNYNFNDEDVSALPPLITANRKILDFDRERDWVDRHHDSTVIKNVGKWYIGLPPGHSVRAHVQNIDLLPLGGRRVLSPSEALRADEMEYHRSSRENVAA